MIDLNEEEMGEKESVLEKLVDQKKDSEEMIIDSIGK